MRRLGCWSRFGRSRSARSFGRWRGSLLKLNADVVSIDGLEGRSELGADFFVHPSIAEPFRAIGVFGLKNENAVIGTDEVYGCEGSADLGSRGFLDLF